MIRLSLKAPLAGWLLPLSDVPDPVFAQGMAGDGLAIDPTSELLCAPCAGEVLPLGDGARHAISLRIADGVDLLMHVGIDTVALGGTGFECLVQSGQKVECGQPLLRFDLQTLVEQAPSAVTPIILAAGGQIIARRPNRVVAVGDELMELLVESPTAANPAQVGPRLRRQLSIPFEHGLHARPAAQLVSAMRAFDAEVSLHVHGRRADLSSTVSLMALGLRCGEVVEAEAAGAQAAAALDALVGLLAPAAVIATTKPQPDFAAQRSGSRRVSAVTAVHGKALGVAVPLLADEEDVAEHAAPGDDPAMQLQQAKQQVQAHLENLLQSASGEQSEILSAHLELLQDPQLQREAKRKMDEAKSAAFAWRAATRAARAELNALADPHLRARAADLRDLEQQVLRVLGGEAVDAKRDLPDQAVVIADELLPSEFMRLNLSQLSGIVMARGGSTSHVAIMAASHNIPTLVAAGREVLSIAPGTPLILDGDTCTLHIDPPAAKCAAVTASLKQQAERERADLAAARAPCHSLDGVNIAVLANIGSLAEAERAVTRGAEGCGLLRSEFLYLDRREAPDEITQRREYAAFAKALEDLPLTIRTLDAGGDKPIAYLPLPFEENPALGLRGLRTGLRHPDILNTQLRALLSLKRAQQIRILLPMVNDLEELAQVRDRLDALAGELGLEQTPALGVMIETPASALLAADLLREADFLSIGSNDLSQYVLAMDRGHAELAARLDGLHPAVLRLMAEVARAGAEVGKKVSICGGLAADPQALPILLGLGLRELSVVAGAVPRLKAQVRRLAISDCKLLAQQSLAKSSARQVRELARHWQPTAMMAMEQIG